MRTTTQAADADLQDLCNTLNADAERRQEELVGLLRQTISEWKDKHNLDHLSVGFSVGQDEDGYFCPEVHLKDVSGRAVPCPSGARPLPIRLVDLLAELFAPRSRWEVTPPR